MSDIEIEVDGLPVEVDEAAYDEDPEIVEKQVRQARNEARLSEEQVDEILSRAPNALTEEDES